jgi:hypothetical protein
MCMKDDACVIPAAQRDGTTQCGLDEVRAQIFCWR